MMSEVICILAALKEEIAGIKGQMTITESLRLKSAHALSGTWQGKEVLVLLSGIGKYRAAEALSMASSRFPLSTVISIGYAGGLHADLKEGDLVLANRVFDSDMVVAQSQQAPSSGMPLDKVFIDRLAGKFPGPTYHGGLLTMDAAVCKPEEKKALGTRYPVIAVDMETAGILPLAQEKQLSILSVRAITDTVDHELVNFSSCMDATGEISRVKAGWHILTHPATLPKIRALRDHCRLATYNLTQFVAHCLKRA